jgi:hypothetical protein
MATLLLSAAGSFVGGAVGGPLGATIGRAVGAIAGSVVDQAIIGALTPARKVQGPRLTSVDITSSTEGAAITRLFGRSRLAGQMIWATRFEEVISKETTGGGKGFSGPKVTTTTYAYFANFAVALCEGPVTRIGRIWMDGRELDQTQATVRSYLGTEDQSADSLIVAKEGADEAPAYRGVAYLVFERLPLEEYGNRMPVVTAEVFRVVGKLEPLVKGVALIPGSTEFGYDPAEVTRQLGKGSYAPENRHTKLARSDLAASLDLLEDVAPNARLVNLVAAWFGDDLRAGHCTIRPKVENATKETRTGGSSLPWSVAGLDRSTAQVMTQIDGGPAYGGAPNDAGLIAGIQELKARGLRVMVYPFIMMDIPSDNALPDPYSDNAGSTGQAAYPWRGRITVSPAAGFAGSPDKTSAAASQIADFLGTANAVDFATSSGTTVTYTGPAEWSYRRFILHMAKVCELAGGVDLFCIGSEMVGLTQARDGAASYPFVAGLVDLAAQVRTILGAGTRIGYAADWSEYHSHRPGDGSGDVLFNLDPLWAHADIDFIGIDNYLPLADWRDGSEHLDYSSGGPTTIYDLDYLKGNVEGGEYYDWYYPAAGVTGNEASPERIAQSRTEIVDSSAAAEHWVFRQKDIRNWWLNAHHDRPGGTRAGAPTGWVAQSKPVIFTELGCPAVDKGANQPNVFFDPKTSESFLPYFSSGARDDAMQRAYLEAAITYWEDDGNNPPSGAYAGRMIETESTCIWSWDARMVPSFPDDEATWADAPNWELGHWISGRLGAASGQETFAAVMDAYGFADYSVAPLGGVVDGVVIDRILSARDVIDAIAPAYFAYAVESQGEIRIGSRMGAPVEREFALDDLVEFGAEERFARRRAQETDLPAVVKLGYGEPTSDDLAGAVEARRLAGAVVSSRTQDVALPVVMPESRARAVAEALLHDAWAAREGLDFALPPSELALDAGDVVRLSAGSADTFRLTEIADGESRRMRAAREDASLYAAAAAPRRARSPGFGLVLDHPETVFLDGALLRDGDNEWAGYIAALLKPWPGAVAFYRSPGSSGFLLDTVLTAPAGMGQLAFDFWSGPTWRWDRGNELWVDLFSGTLASADELAVLGGANAIAVENTHGEWEVVQFATAELVSAGRYKLTTLLRGQRGSEHAMASPVAAGARVLVLTTALGQPGIAASDIGLPIVWRAGPANRDVADTSFVEETVTMTGKGRRPLSPVHVAGRQPSGSDDIKLSWTRRTRIGGDGWSQVDVPLAEATEGYEVEILDGATTLRTLAAASPSVTYTSAQQTADFGAPIAWPSTLAVRVYQLSTTYGRGMPAEATLFFPLPVEV